MVEVDFSWGFHVKKQVISTSMVLALFLLAGCSAGDAIAPETSASAPSDAVPGVSAGGNCTAYVDAVKRVCLDGVTRGLDVSCDNEIMRVGGVQDMAAGTLFDVGSGAQNAGVAEAACAQFLTSLQEKRQSKDAGMRVGNDIGPKCAAFVENFETTCLRDLGGQPFPDNCRMATRMLRGAAIIPPEDLCESAGSELEHELE